MPSIFPNSQSLAVSSTLTLQKPHSDPKLYLVRITSPSKGQADNNTSNCENGHIHYSKWNFILSPTYTSTREEQNKITAKFLCNDKLLVSRLSVNVTGVKPTGLNSASTTSLFLQILLLALFLQIPI